MREYVDVQEGSLDLSEVCRLLVGEVARLQKENDMLRFKIVNQYCSQQGTGMASLVKLADDRGLLVFEDQVIKLGSTLAIYGDV